MMYSNEEMMDKKLCYGCCTKSIYLKPCFEARGFEKRLANMRSDNPTSIKQALHNSLN